jgi:menaquinone-dependent protoporphyrinogen oxidase
VAPVQEVGSIEGYGAVVLGSAIYLGQWMKPAKEFAARETAALSSVPVWLFSSGPVASPDQLEDAADRRKGDEITTAIGPAITGCSGASPTARAST